MAAESVHVIRLRGPWQVVRWSAGLARSQPATLKLPTTIEQVIGGEFCGSVELSRAFQWPEPLVPGERLWLVVAQAERPTFAATLNGRPLDDEPGERALPAGWDISDVVGRSNELRLAWQIDEPGVDRGDSWVDVQLEVRDG